MTAMQYPAMVLNLVGGRPQPAQSGQAFDKVNPATGLAIAKVARSARADVDAAIAAAQAAQPGWAARTPVARGQLLQAVAAAMRARAAELAAVVALETGKSRKDAAGEVAGAIQLGEFFAGEGLRLFGRTLPSAMAGKFVATIRQPHGVAGLIVPANTPIANVAWKVFPALICGNAAVLKASEDTPYTASLFAEIASAAGLPDGVLNIVHGFGAEAGAPLVEDGRVAVISFTGSTATGRWIAEVAGRRLARVSLELGGKNPLIVCDDADLDNAVRWSLLSAFSNAGQRCAAASRIIVFDAVYDAFRHRLLERTAQLKLGTGDDDDLGPVINARQLASILGYVERARQQGASVICGGVRLQEPGLAGGFFVAPTLLENVAAEAEISCREVFGPVAALYRVADFNQALALANASEYGLTAAIHTKNIDRAMQFAQQIRAGVANVNIGTYGSEPHMPFGGFGASGNGSREPGTEALDVYSEIKNVSIWMDAAAIA